MLTPVTLKKEQSLLLGDVLEKRAGDRAWDTVTRSVMVSREALPQLLIPDLVACEESRLQLC